MRLNFFSSCVRVKGLLIRDPPFFHLWVLGEAAVSFQRWNPHTREILGISRLLAPLMMERGDQTGRQQWFVLADLRLMRQPFNFAPASSYPSCLECRVSWQDCYNTAIITQQGI